jgi:hypothetical protein
MDERARLRSVLQLSLSDKLQCGKSRAKAIESQEASPHSATPELLLNTPLLRIFPLRAHCFLPYSALPRRPYRPVA